MYKVIRFFLFLFNPEFIHHTSFRLLKFGAMIPGKMLFWKLLFKVRNHKLEREVFGLKFKNPVGMAAGLKFYVFLNSNLLTQIKTSMVDLSGSYYNIINEIIILFGVICGLVYFFFSKEHVGVVGKISRIGVYFLMIKFGASFGFAVMGRISLLIGRFEELITFSKPEYYYSTPVILIIMVITLAYWSFKSGNENKKNIA